MKIFSAQLQYQTTYHVYNYWEYHHVFDWHVHELTHTFHWQVIMRVCIAFCILAMELSENSCVLNWDGFLAASAHCAHIQRLGAAFQKNPQDLSTTLAAWRC